MSKSLPNARSVAVNPSPTDLRRWAENGMVGVTLTEFGNLNYQSRTTARLKNSTFFVSDHEIHQNRISCAEAQTWADLQDAYVSKRDMILIEGYVGADPAFRTPCRLYIEKTQPNIAAMQRHLYFPVDEAWSPRFTVIYTPGLPAPGKPDDCLITVDLENFVTRVFGSDYFGESKMGGLRMWNKHVYDHGGLALHAGLKTFPGDDRERSMLIIGLSGTGKTTTTFRKQLGSLPVQDDFVALMPGGEIHASENGCFAKTFGLDPVEEPTIYGGATSDEAWLENVSVSNEGKVDFYDTNYTANGRCTFPLEGIEHRSPVDLPKVDYLIILNRNENVIPAVARLSRSQATAYFMLGETKGTSAGGSAEAGRNLRVPGTNPFFFNDDAWQGNRFSELLETVPHLEVYLMNTGRVGGPADDQHSKDIRIADSSSIVQAIVAGTIRWETDPDFGYEVAAEVPGITDIELLQPVKLYERQGRLSEYQEVLVRLRGERIEYLSRYTSLRPEIATHLVH